MTLFLIALIASGTPAPPPDANAARRGLVNTTSQTFGGKKTFVDGGIVAESLTISSASSDAGFTVLSATNAAMTLFVDPTGNDANACTDGGIGACATFNGIYAKLPKVLRHDITVNVAAGAYAFTSRWDGVHWGSASTSGILGTTVSFDGPALLDATPTTGTATGTLTSAVPGPSPLPVFTDSAQTWTVNDLRGYFLVMTSGAQSGNSRPIIANTATTITTGVWSTDPLSGSTYAIRKPAAVITGEQTFTGHRGAGGALRFQRLEFTSASTSASTLDARSFQPTAVALSLPSCRVFKTAGAFNPVTASDTGPWQGSSTLGWYYAQTTGTGIAVNFNRINSLFQGLFVAYAASTRALSINNNGASARISWANVVAETGAGAGTAIFLAGLSGDASGLTASNLHARCPVGSTGFGVYMPGSTLGQRNVEVVNCGTGVQVGASTGEVEAMRSMFWVSTSFRCTNTTTCLSLVRGSRAIVGPVPSFTGVTSEYVVDGAATTEAAFAVGVPPRVVGASGSYLERL